MAATAAAIAFSVEGVWAGVNNRFCWLVVWDALMILFPLCRVRVSVNTTSFGEVWEDL